MAINHAKASAIADDPAAAAAGEVLPSDWNDDHVITGDVTLPANLDFSGAGSRALVHGTTGPIADRTIFQCRDANSNTVFGAMPSGSGTIAAIQVYDRSDLSAGAAFGDIRSTPTAIQFTSNSVDGTGVAIGPTILPMIWKLGSNTRMTLDTTGALGLGTTPAAAGAGYTHQYIGACATMLADSASGANTSFQHNNNASYTSGGWTYIASAKASQMVLTAGHFVIRTAVAGTAGTALTWNEVYRQNHLGDTLTGYMALGGSAIPTYGNGWRTFTVKGGATATDGTGTPGGGVVAARYYDDSVIMEMSSESTAGVLRTTTNHPLKFYTNGALAATLAVGGNYTVVGGLTVNNTASIVGNIASTGVAAGVSIDDRAAGTGWTWYGTGNTMRFWNGSDRFTLDASGNVAAASVAVTGALTSSGGGVGYAAGAGGTVTQATSKSTGVTLNKLCGLITMNAASLASAGKVTFTVTDSLMGANDVVIAQHDSGGTVGAYLVNAGASAAGSFQITIRNLSTGALAEALVIRFVIVKAAVA